MFVLLGLTIFLWFTEKLHGIPAWIVTLGSIAAMLIMGVLHFPGLIKAIDVSMLIFLTAAMSIGGVMSANGSANIVFSAIQKLIPMHSVYLAIGVIMLITICMHMFLGSNTTTLSVVIPGVVYICKDILPIPIIMLIIYITLATQWLFPFQSVGLMMGASKKYFPSKYIFMIGIPMTFIVFIAIYALYIPWWKFLGLITW